MFRLALPTFTLVVLAAAACGQAGTPATQPAESAGHTSPAQAGQPPRGWLIHTNLYARFTVWHPPGWAVVERHGQDRSLELALTPPGGTGGVLIRRQFGAPPIQTDLPNTRCARIRISQLPGIRCTDTISGSVVAALTGTGQGDFTFQASRRAPGFAEFDHIVAGFQLIRGAS
jgi:hypothetical protein